MHAGPQLLHVHHNDRAFCTRLQVIWDAHMKILEGYHIHNAKHTCVLG